jgi:hypothetical protein
LFIMLSPIISIQADDTTLHVRFRRTGASVSLVGLSVWEREIPTNTLPLWSGKATGQAISVPRFDEKGRDRLAQRFLAIGSDHQPIGAAQWVTQITGAGVRTHPIPFPLSIKGVQCVVDRADAALLGMKHVGMNLSIREWLMPTEGPREWITMDGERIPIHAGHVARFDEQIKWFTDAGISVTLIFLNYFPRDAGADDVLVHPQTDRKGAANPLSAFNLTNEKSTRLYRGLLTFLAQRYSEPDAKYGRISGLIIGNEVQSHWHWYNMGRQSPEVVMNEYHNALRLAWLAVRSVHSGLRIYTSTDYYWTTSHEGREKTMPGKQLLDGLAAKSKAEGDFDWSLAHHPYPQGLVDPVFWDDDEAPLAFDAPIITFQNIEVLTNYIKRPIMQYQPPHQKRAQTRRLILSEQGFNCKAETEEAEIRQAAAYAYAFHKIKHLPEIDAFLLHRHVDHRDEGGLKLGLWSARTDTKDPSVPHKKRKMWHVAQKADTPDWEAAFAFALPVCGLKNWNAALPFTGNIPETSPKPKPFYTGKLLFDLVALQDEAKITNCLDWRRTKEITTRGTREYALFQHPQQSGNGDAVFSLTLPTSAKHPTLFFETQNGATQPAPKGIRFAVLVGERELWAAVVTDNLRPTAHQVDLTPYVGKTISLTLRVNAQGNVSYAWANWIALIIVDKGDTSKRLPQL